MCGMRFQNPSYPSPNAPDPEPDIDDTPREIETTQDDEEWPWPRFQPGAPRNYRRYHHERFKGWEGDFLKHFREHGVVSLAAKACHISASMVFNTRDRDRDFDTAFKEAKEEALDKLEAAILKRAREGVQEVKEVWEYSVKQKSLVLVKRETSTRVSDTLAMFILKAGRPHIYREAVDHHHRVSIAEAEVRRLAAEKGMDESATQSAVEEAMRLMGVKR